MLGKTLTQESTWGFALERGEQPVNLSTEEEVFVGHGGKFIFVLYIFYDIL